MTRSVEPTNGGVGPLFVAVMDSDPVAGFGGPSPEMISFVLIEEADMTDPATEIPYRIDGIPPRAAPYFVTAFLDDNQNANLDDPDAAGPDQGDLVVLEGFASPSVRIETPGAHEFDIVLNVAMPF